MSRPSVSALSTSLRQLSTSAPLRATVSALPLSSSSSASPTSTPAPAIGSDRVYPARKAFLHAYYSHLLSTSELVLLFSHANLTVAELNKVRRALAKLPPPPSGAGVGEGKQEGEGEGEKATLTITRTGLLSALFPRIPASDATPSPSSSSSSSSSPSASATTLPPHSRAHHLHPSLPSLQPYLTGPTALLTSPSLSPPYLAKVLQTITRTLKSLKREFPPTIPADVQAAKQPRLTLVAGIMEKNRLLDIKGVEDVGKLPSLDQLRGQLVGLLEMPQRQLVGVLTQAGGGGLVRTLQGLEEGLRKEAEGQGAEVGAGKTE